MNHLSSNQSEGSTPAAPRPPRPAQQAQAHASLASSQPSITPPLPSSRPLAVRYAAALLAVLATWALRAALDPQLQGLQPFTLFFFPVLLLGWWAGPGPASLAAALGWFIADYFFCGPRHTILGGGVQEIIASLIYIALSAALITITRHLRRALRRVETILNSITDAFFSLDRQWHFTYANPEAQRLLRQPAAQLLGHNLWDLFPQAEGFRLHYEQALATRQAAHFEQFYAPLQAWFEVNAYPSPAGLSVYFRDITPAKQAQAAERQAEENLRRSERHFRALADSLPQLVWTTDAEGRVDYLSPQWTALTGQPTERALAYGWAETLHPEDRPRTLECWAAAARAGHVYETEHRLRSRDGQYRWFLNRAIPLRDPLGRVERWFGTSTDITHQKQTEQALQQAIAAREESLVQLQATLASMTEALIIAEPGGSIINFNPAALRLHGYASLEQARHQIAEYPQTFDVRDANGTLLPPEAWPVARALRGEVVADFEMHVRRRDTGQHFIGSYSAAPIRNPAGDIILALTVIRDITARKQTEAALRASEERYRTLFESIDEGFCVIELLFDEHPTPIDYRFLQTNPAFTRQTGGAFASGKTARQGVPNLEPYWFELYGRVARTRHPVRYDHYSEATRRWFAGYAFPIGPANQHQVGVLFTDITLHKQAEQALRESEERHRLVAEELRAIMDAAPAGVLVAHDPECRLVTGNGPAHELLGVPPQENISASPSPAQLSSYFRAFRQGREVAPAELPMQLAAATGTPVRDDELEVRRSDGSRRTLLVTAAPLFTAQGARRGSVGVVTDITALQRRNQHLQLLHEASARLLTGQHPVELLRQLHPHLDKSFGADALMLYETDPANGHLHLLACAGVSGEQKQKLETLRFGRAVCARPQEALHPIIATHLQLREQPNRRFLRKLGFRAYLYYPLIINGRLHGTVAFASRTRDDYDPTDLDFFHTLAGTLAEALERVRLQAELQRHAQTLEHTVGERTAALRETIGELEGFSYSLIHDLRAPLRAMHSYAGIIEAEAAPGLQPDHLDLLRRIRTSTTRMDQLITDSLNYTRILRQELPVGPVNLGTLLRGMLDTYPNLHAPHADITLEFADFLVYSNEAALTQVFSNLLGNAVKFVAPGVHPRIRLWTEPSPLAPEPPPPSAHASRLAPQEPSTHFVRVYIQDNGVGIPKDQHEKIFRMFHRLHRSDEYPGTGIGLALVKKSLDRTGGRISLESEPGSGTRFCVELPLATSPVEVSAT